MPDEVTAAEIARLAGVGRAAVSNWRRRHSDFPKPVGGPPTSPTFSLAEVEAWLKANGRRIVDRAATGPRLPDGGIDLAAAVASLLPTRPPNLILDPACDTGTMLVAAARRYGPSVTYVGQDADQARVDIARRALADVGVNPDELVLGSPFATNALDRYRGCADAVVCLPPARASWPIDDGNSNFPWEFAPPSQFDPFLAWLQVCYAYLKPGGVAVIPMPQAAAVRASGRRVRAEMLRAGALRQVVALPERFATQLAGPWQIWLLGRPHHRPQYTVRMVDLTRARREDVPTSPPSWRGVYRDPGTCCDVEAIELLDEDVLLLPTRHVPAPVRDVGPEYDKLRTEVARAAAALDIRLPALPSSPEPAPQTMISVMDLVRLGAIVFVGRGEEVRPGDVIVPTRADRFDAVVVSETDRHPTGEVLRCDPTVIDPYFLACFLRSDANRRHASGTLGGSARLDLRRARIPRLSISEQRQYGKAFRRLTDATDQIERVRALAAQAVQAAVYGLTSGVLLPGR